MCDRAPNQSIEPFLAHTHQRRLNMTTSTKQLAAILGLGIVLAIGGTQAALAGANDGGPFSQTQWGSQASALVTNQKATSKATNAYNSYAAPRHQSNLPRITLPSATPEGNRAGWFMD